jgi:hypothetical protein
MSNNPDEHNYRRHLKSTSEELFRHGYLTLLGLGQAVAFHLLSEKFFHLYESGALNFYIIIFSLATVMALIHTWNEYFMVLSLFRWIPTLIDAMIPFAIFIAEVFLAKNINDPFIWLIAMGAYVFFAVTGYIYMAKHSKKYPENNIPLNLSRKRTKKVKITLLLISFFSFLIAFSGYFNIINFNENTMTILGVSYFLILTIFSIDTYLFWNMILRFIRDDKGEDKL